MISHLTGSCCCREFLSHKLERVPTSAPHTALSRRTNTPRGSAIMAVGSAQRRSSADNFAASGVVGSFFFSFSFAVPARARRSKAAALSARLAAEDHVHDEQRPPPRDLPPCHPRWDGLVRKLVSWRKPPATPGTWWGAVYGKNFAFDALSLTPSRLEARSPRSMLNSSL